jgi:hypothetical protein
VIEGGFHPDEVTPRPPFRVEPRKGKPPLLIYDEASAGHGEQTLLGGLKTKNVDVVVTKRNLGPVLAVSCKGVMGAFRNLTNRMEELIGECTNLHISMPTLVLGYVVVLRANRTVQQVLETAVEDDELAHDEAAAIELDEELADEAAVPVEDVIDAAAEEVGEVDGDARVDAPKEREIKANDIAITDQGVVVEGIVRFHNALREIARRRGIRNDSSRYEAIAMALVEMDRARRGELVATYPEADSLLRLERFFQQLYAQYDERFVVSAPLLADRPEGTRRLAWSPNSPALTDVVPDYEVRLGVEPPPKPSRSRKKKAAAPSMTLPGLESET